MNHGSLFSGIGGFDLAAEWMGWNNIFHCEWNEFGQKVLKYYWPNAITYGDITKTDFTIHRGNIDILTGGFPCQPYSMAGKRKGKEDERHLWPEMLRAIREIQPLYVVGENVPGLINWNGGMVFDEVQTDLETAGYEVIPFVLPACGVNAPHRRDRVWFVAYSNSSRNTQSGLQQSNLPTRSGRNNKKVTSNTKTSQNPLRDGCLQRELVKEGAEIREQRNTCTGNSKRVCESADAGIVADTVRPGFKVGVSGGFGGVQHQAGTSQGGEFARTYPAGDWSEFPTQPPVRGRNDGLPSRLSGITFSKHRNESIKAYGNAIVPQVDFQIFKAIEQFECLKSTT